MDINTILGSTTATAINVNGLYVRAREIGSVLQLYCDPALFHTAGTEPYTLSKSGSAFRVKFGDRYFCITTWHQLKNHGYRFEQLCVPNNELKKVVTSEGASFFRGEDNTELEYDFLMFEFTTPVHQGLLSRQGWYNIESDLQRRKTPKPNLTIAIGYPGCMNEIDYDRMAYNTRPYAIYGREARSSITGRLALEPHPKILFDPAGMSGGPVFGISVSELGPSLFFAGIISEATSSKFNFVPFSRLSRAIEKFLAQPPVLR